MSELTTPFDYRNILIGEEIIYRALLQQEDHAQQGKYGATWTAADQLEKSAMYFKLNVMRADFAIPAEFQHCFPKPPCPFPKDNDTIHSNLIKPVICGSDGVYTYGLSIHARTDSGGSYTVGAKIFDFVNNQNMLAAVIRGEFLYYDVNRIAMTSGLSVFVVDKFHRGSLERQFFYLFELTN